MVRKIWLAVAAVVAIVAALGIYLSLPQPTAASSQAMRLPVDPVPLIAETAAANAPSASRSPTTRANARPG